MFRRTYLPLMVLPPSSASGLEPSVQPPSDSSCGPNRSRLDDSADGPPSTVVPESRSARFARLGFLTVAAAVCWLNLIFFPLAPSLGLDASWQLALHHDWTHRLAFGREVVFTYGPWGWLTTQFSSPENFASQLVWDLAWKAGCVVLLACVASRLGWLRRVVLMTGALVLLPFFQDTLLVLVILGLTLWLMQAPVPPRRVLLPVLGLLGLLSLQKFTSFVLIAGGVVLICTTAFMRRDARKAAWIGGGWAVSLLVWWLAAAQSLADLPRFIQRSALVASGYSEAMFFNEPTHLLGWGLGAAALYLVLIAERPTWARLPRLLALFAFGLAVWKHGFVRADGHMLVFFLFVFFVAIAAPAAVAFGLRRQIASWSLAAVGLVGAWQVTPAVIPSSLTPIAANLHRNFDLLRDLGSYRRSFDQGVLATQSAAALPAVRSHVGSATIDQFGFEQSVLLSNGLHYAPRPVLQSYQAYSGPLAVLNENYYLSSAAPAFTLVQLQSIDSRYPPVEDARLLPRLITDHDFVLAEKGYLLLRRHSAPAELSPRVLTAGRLRYHIETCDVPRSDEALWVRLDAPPSWLGLLRIIFYKPPEVTLVLQTTGGRESRFRLIVPAARAGFLLSPLLENTSDLQALIAHRTGQPVARFRLEIDPDDAVYFLKRARYEISALPALHFASTAP